MRFRISPGTRGSSWIRFSRRCRAFPMSMFASIESSSFSSMQATRAFKYGSVWMYEATRKRRSPSRMIWMVLPETLILLTRRAATPMVDSSSMGGTSMEEDFCTTSPMMDSGSMSRIRLRFFFLTTWRLTTICGKTTVDASGMMGSSTGMSQASISPWARSPAAAIFSAVLLSISRSVALSVPLFLFPGPLIVWVPTLPRHPVSAPGAASVPAAVGEEAVRDDFVDQLRRQEVRGDVVSQGTQLVHVEADEPLLPAHPPDERQGLVPPRAARLRRPRGRHDGRVEVIHVDRKVYLLRQPVNQFQRPFRARHEVARRHDHEALGPDQIPLFAGNAADSHLEGRQAPGEVVHGAGVAELRPFVGRTQVAVGVELDDRQLRVLLVIGLDRPDRHAVLAPDDDRHLALLEEPDGRLLDLPGHDFRRVVVAGDGRRGVDADRVGIAVQLVVVQLHEAGGLDDGLGPLCRALHVGRGAIVGDRQDHHPGLLERGALLVEAAVVHGWVGMERHGRQGMRTAAVTTVVQRPRLSPTADWQVFMVR